MRDSAGVDATQPSATTGCSTSGPKRIALHWVSPASVVSVLAEGHTFGRDPSCDSVLAGTEVSRAHARIRMTGPLPVLCDLGSRNGVYVAGKRVTERTLGPGDVVRVGEWVGIAVEVEAATAPEVDVLREIVPGWYGGSQLVAAMEPLRRIAATDLPVVIQGETGSGKEGAASALHLWSGRKGPLVAVDCGALPEHLAEALLFGQRKGAFTGADRSTPGHLRAADGGTIFLDEILNLAPPLQAKLLRAIESRSVVPVGDTQPVALDVRFVCAAQEALADAVSSGRFRADLMARLEGFTLQLPALRTRREDVVPLFFELLERHGGQRSACEPRFVESLLLYDWPLNVRELLLLARRLATVHGGEALKRSMLPERMLSASAPDAAPPPPAAARKATDDDEDFNALVASLREHQGNLTRAAAALGFTRARAYRLLEARPEFDLAPLRKDSGA